MNFVSCGFVCPLDFICARFARLRMGTLSEDDARRIGAGLKRWSQRPVRETNARTIGLCAILIVMMLILTQRTPNSAAAIEGIATVCAGIQAILHLASLGMLRGLLRTGVGEAQDALNAMRDPRRISNFDMAMLWTMAALVATILAESGVARSAGSLAGI